MDRQAIFNRVRDHLLAQKVRSVAGNKCLYRGPDGRKCAIGALIDDEHYSPIMDAESLNSSAYDVHKALEKSGIKFQRITYDSGGDAWFLRSLQELHDDHDDGNPDSWDGEFTRFAEAWGLQP